jgi:hypothetical protein
MTVFARSDAMLNSGSVIPGWSEGPDLRCAIAHRGISRFRVRCGACHRAALRADPLAAPRNDGVWVASRNLSSGAFVRPGGVLLRSTHQIMSLPSEKIQIPRATAPRDGCVFDRQK